jgi:hypothetical protein
MKKTILAVAFTLAATPVIASDINQHTWVQNKHGVPIIESLSSPSVFIAIGKCKNYQHLTFHDLDMKYKPNKVINRIKVKADKMNIPF